MSYHDLKAAIYICLTIFGMALVVASFISARTGYAVDQLTAWVMLVAGTGMTLFGMATYFLRDDLDVWR